MIITAIIKVGKNWRDSQKHGGVKSLLDLSPRNYNKLNSCDPTENTQPNIQTHLRDLHMGASEGRWIRRARRRKGRREETGPMDAAWSSLWDWRGENYIAVCTLYRPEQFCLNDQYILPGGAQWLGQRPGQKWNITILAIIIARQKVESWSLGTSLSPLRACFLAPSQS